jgi:hypothetical protein
MIDPNRVLPTTHDWHARGRIGRVLPSINADWKSHHSIQVVASASICVVKRHDFALVGGTRNTERFPVMGPTANNAAMVGSDSFGGRMGRDTSGREQGVSTADTSASA